MPSLIHNLVFSLHYGKMPVAGLLGFPPFALESFALYYFLRWALRLELFDDCVKVRHARDCSRRGITEFRVVRRVAKNLLLFV